MQTMTIGKLAKQSRVNIDAIRYERQSLPPRAARLGFMRRGSELGCACAG
jgi:DNA-binding transcriptional MerR regulator